MPVLVIDSETEVNPDLIEVFSENFPHVGPLDTNPVHIVV